jgi:CRP-like cAMP-binding protein
MNTQPLFQTLNSIAILSPQAMAKISTCLVEEEVKKKTLILKQGQVAHRICFIKKGFVRAFYTNATDTFTNWFMGPGEIIISVYSFFSR